MKTKFLFCLCIILLVADCSSNRSKQETTFENKYVYHFNVNIVPDLSNRIQKEMYPKPVDDRKIISTVLDLIDPEILELGREEGQQDIFKTKFINEGVISLYGLNMNHLQIDFAKFGKEQINRIDYIKGLRETSLKSDLDNYESEIDKAYNAAMVNTFGADIWSFFNRLDDYSVRDVIDTIVYRGASTRYIQKYKNILILLTDGYLEAGIYDENGCEFKNQCYFLSGKTIRDFRTAFKNSGFSDMKKFFVDQGYGIVPVKNETLKNLDVIVLEAYDRSLDKSGNATVFPSDFEIMKLFWEDWMFKSGARSFEIHQAVPDENEAREKIKSFIGLR